MEQIVLQKIARLRSLAAKQGQAFDVVRFACDAVYARQTLVALLSTDDENLLVLGLELLQALGMVDLNLAPPNPPADVPTQPPTQTDIAKASRSYVGTLRG